PASVSAHLTVRQNLFKLSYILLRHHTELRNIAALPAVVQNFKYRPAVPAPHRADTRHSPHKVLYLQIQHSLLHGKPRFKIVTPEKSAANGAVANSAFVISKIRTHKFDVLQCKRLKLQKSISKL